MHRADAACFKKMSLQDLCFVYNQILYYQICGDYSDIESRVFPSNCNIFSSSYRCALIFQVEHNVCPAALPCHCPNLVDVLPWLFSFILCITGTSACLWFSFVFKHCWWPLPSLSTNANLIVCVPFLWWLVLFLLCVCVFVDEFFGHLHSSQTIPHYNCDNYIAIPFVTLLK